MSGMRRSSLLAAFILISAVAALAASMLLPFSQRYSVSSTAPEILSGWESWHFLASHAQYVSIDPSTRVGWTNLLTLCSVITTFFLIPVSPFGASLFQGSRPARIIAISLSALSLAACSGMALLNHLQHPSGLVGMKSGVYLLAAAQILNLTGLLCIPGKPRALRPD